MYLFEGVQMDFFQYCEEENLSIDDVRKSSGEFIADLYTLYKQRDVLQALEWALKYLRHPDMRAITDNMALSGSILDKRISDVLNKDK